MYSTCSNADAGTLPLMKRLVPASGVSAPLGAVPLPLLPPSVLIGVRASAVMVTAPARMTCALFAFPYSSFQSFVLAPAQEHDLLCRQNSAPISHDAGVALASCS